MPAAAGFAQFQAIAEWKSRAKSYVPNTGLMDHYARFVTDRWVYSIAATAMPYEVDQKNYRDAEIIREYYIDGNGALWATTKATPYAPITERGDPVRATGDGYPGGLFPRLTAAGQAVWSWLILSPFQLPSSTVKALDSKELFHQIRTHVPPLWDWQRKTSLLEDHAALESKDGWSLLETPLWLSKAKEGPYARYGSAVRVAVGFDPFAVAKERSRAFVDLYLAYQRRFEPLSPTPGGEYQRMALAQRIDDIVVLNEQARERFGKYVDIGALNEAVVPYQKERRQAIQKYEEAAARVSEIVLSDLFCAVLDGAMDTEGLDDDAASPRLNVALEVLAHCTRYIGSAKSGAALMRTWALQSEQDERHFTHRILLPTLENPPNSHFKSFRWSSKAIASTLVQYTTHKVSVARISTKEQVAEMLLEPLAKLAGHKSIAGIDDILQDVVKSSTITPQWRAAEASTVVSVEIRRTWLDANHAKFLEDWLDKGNATRFGRDDKLLATKNLLAAVLDVLNLALACEAAREKIEKNEWPGVALATVGVHALNLSATIVEACATRDDLGKVASTRVRSSIAVMRGVASGVFAVANLYTAVEAYEKNDYSVGAAMSVAALAEATSCGAYIYTAVVGTTAAGPWVILAATLVAAAAYIVATWTKDEPLEVFLENSEFGRAPYGEDDYRPSWSDVTIGRWRSDFVNQQRLFMKILGRFTVSEVARGNPIAGIKVELSMFTPRSVLTVRFDAEYADGEKVSNPTELTRDDLPDEMPGVVKVAMPTDMYNNDKKPVSLVAVVKFLLLPGDQAEQISLPLVANGKSAFPGPMSSVG